MWRLPPDIPDAASDGVGGVRIQTSQEALEQFLKRPLSPDRQSTASTAPSSLSVQVTADIAVVIVTESSQGCVAGRLEWCDLPRQDVEFSLLQMKPGYTMVRDVFEGPEPFSKVCWKLRCVEGLPGPVHPSDIVKGDRLILEGPRWATDRLCRGGSLGHGGEAPLPAAAPTPAASPAPAARPRGCSSDGAVPALRSPLSTGRPAEAAGDGPEPAGRSQPRAAPPPVPRLDLAGVHASRDGRLGSKGVAMGLGNCGLGLSLPQCGLSWDCL